jgi:GntR family transcriptional regulator
MPLYARVRDELRGLIRGGTYRPYDRLPSEIELVQRFRVSRITVRQALKSLAGEGLIHSTQGKGSFVSMPKAVQDAQVLLGFHEAMQHKGFTSSSRILAVGARRAAREVAEALRLKPGTPVFEVRRVRCIEGAPVSLDLSYFPLDIGERLRQHDLACDIFPLLESSCGIALARAEVRVEAVASRRDVAEALAIVPGQPVLHMRRLSYSAGGRPVDYEHLYCRGDAYECKFELARRRPR